MITITYKQLQNFNGNIPLRQKLMYTAMPTKLAYAFKKLGDKMGIAGEKARSEYMEFLKLMSERYARRDDKGVIIRPTQTNEKGEVTHTDPDGFDLLPEHQPAFQKAKEEFDARTIIIDRNKISLNQIDQAASLQLSVAELAALDPFVSEDEGEVVPLKAGQ